MQTKKVLAHVAAVKIDGLSNITRSKHVVVSLLWLAMLLLNGGLCVWLITDTIKQYMHNKVTTTFRYLTEQEAHFPTIVICNLNPFTADFGLQMIQAANVSAYNGTFGSYSTNIQVFAKMQYYMNATYGRMFTDAEKTRLSDLSRMLIFCRFNHLDCNMSEFEPIFHPVYMNCFRFNGDASHVLSIPGPLSKIQLDLYVGVPDSHPSTSEKGVYIFVLNSTDYVLSYVLSGFMITAGSGMNLVPQRYFYRQSAMPYSGCSVTQGSSDEAETLTTQLENRTFFDAVRELDYAYSQQTCFAFCQQEYQVKQCNCLSLLINYSLAGDYAHCMNPEQYECARVTYMTFASSEYFKERCVPMCPLECEQRVITPVVSSYAFPSSPNYVELVKARSDLVSKHVNESDFVLNLATNVVRVIIYYDTFSYIQVEEEAKMTTEDLVGIVGGHLHLFLGMSLMSFVELFELALYLLRVLIRC